MTDPIPVVSDEHTHVWHPVRYDCVRPGDWLANVGEVTNVISGPGDEMRHDEVRIECGTDYARTSRRWKLLIVGRRIATMVDPFDD